MSEKSITTKDEIECSVDATIYLFETFLKNKDVNPGVASECIKKPDVPIPITDEQIERIRKTVCEYRRQRSGAA